MASTKSVIVATAFLVVLGAIVGGAVALGAEELLVALSNGGFESGKDGLIDPAMWNATRPARMKEFVILEWDSKTFHSGRRSVSITIADNHPDDQVYYNWNQAPLRCEPGESYEISAWVKARNLTESAFVAVQCWDRGMKKVLGSANTEKTSPVVGSTEWVQVKTTFAVPPDSWRVVALLGLPGHVNRGGRVWFDDVAVVAVPGN